MGTSKRMIAMKHQNLHEHGHQCRYPAGGGRLSEGFTLIEVLIALAIFSIGFMAVAAGQTAALRNVRSSQDNTLASAFLNEQVERLSQLPLYNDPFNTNFTINADFQNPTGGGTRSVTSDDGQFEVHWWMTDVDALEVANRWRVGAPAVVARAVTVTVIRSGRDPVADALMRVEFIKSWATHT
jgi:prepilin-type N-terminal cleavage/methylation domain-containing protein